MRACWFAKRVMRSRSASAGGLLGPLRNSSACARASTMHTCKQGRASRPGGQAHRCCLWQKRSSLTPVASRQSEPVLPHETPDGSLRAHPLQLTSHDTCTTGSCAHNGLRLACSWMGPWSVTSFLLIPSTSSTLRMAGTRQVHMGRLRMGPVPSMRSGHSLRHACAASPAAGSARRLKGCVRPPGAGALSPSSQGGVSLTQWQRR